MLFIRSLLYFIGSVISALVIGPIAFLLFFMPINLRYKLISQWAKFNIWSLGTICNLKINVIGKENIPDKPCIIISNHQSTCETLAFQTIFKHQTWVLKESLLWIPVFGWGLALLAPVVIDRGDKLAAIKKVMKQGADRIKKGINVIIFPEGTRQPFGKLGDYQNGGMAIAKKANCDIIPVYHNAGKFWPKGKFVKHPGVINIVIGKPIDPENKKTSTLTKEVKDWTEAQSLSIQ